MGSPGDVRREVLDNGLTVLVREDRGAPVVAVMTWVKSGYFHEDDEQVGIAHVAEHMYFNGTLRRPGAEDIAREVKGLGGELNAGTSYDATSYHVVLPAENLAHALDIQADAFASPLLDGEVLRSELGAVVQEAKRKLDNPMAVARETMYALAHDVHRVRRWRIGTEPQLRAYTREHVRRWWDDHYLAGNSIVAVVGAVDPDEALAALRDRFASLPSGPVRRAGSPPEPPWSGGLRLRRLTGDVRASTLVVGFRTVPALHDDAPALDVLAAVLADGRASRLVRSLREEQRIVTTVDATSHQIDDVGLFEILAEMPAARLAEARRAVFEEIGRAWREPPTDEEMARARRRIEAASVFARASMLGQARLLASHEALGGHAIADRWLADVLAVPASEVARVAREYLRPDRAAIVEHVPADFQDEPADAAALESELAAASGNRPEPGAAARVPGTVAAPGTPSAATPSDWTLDELPGGVRLAHRLLPHLPTVGLVAGFAGGRSTETPEVAGVTHLLAASLTRGTADLDAAAVAARMEGLGSSLRAVVADDWWGLGAGFLAGDAEAAGRLLVDALLRPRLDGEEIAKERALQSQRRARLEDQPLPWAATLARRAAYGDAPPGLPELGTEASLAALGADAVRERHRGARAGDLVLVVAGDVTASRARELALGWLDGWRGGGADPPREVPETFLPARREAVSRRKEQTTQVIALPGLPAAHPDAAVLDVIAAFCSSLGGRFFEEVRTRRGLAYVVGAAATARRRGGHLLAYLATSPQDEEQAREVLLAEVARVAREPADGEELARAREYLCGGFALGLQGAVAQAGRAASWLGLGLPLEDLEAWPARVRRVTRDDVARVAAELLRPELASWAVVRGGAEAG